MFFKKAENQSSNIALKKVIDVTEAFDLLLVVPGIVGMVDGR